MFYVSVSRGVLDKVIDHVRSSPLEQMGFLVGYLNGSILVIDDSVSGEIQASTTEVIVPAETIAKIADRIVRGEIQGSIVGWYHSHPTGGVFLSETDVGTQLRLQQFSQYVVALVVDPNTGEMGFFTVDRASRMPVPIPTGRILTHPSSFSRSQMRLIFGAPQRP